jgi:RNA polymerase sigma factor (sigma-70 family)
MRGEVLCMSSEGPTITSEFRSDQPATPRDDAPARSGEVHAQRIAELFREDHDKVVHYLVARCGSWAEARDIAAQAFKQMLEVDDPSAIIHLKAYVYKVARNIATDRAKIGAIHRRLNKIAADEIPRTSPSPEPQLCEQERFLTLQRVIDQLPPRCRMALILRIWEELPYAEILSRFATMGVIVNERTLRRWVAYALEYCRGKMLHAEGIGGGDQ